MSIKLTNEDIDQKLINRNIKRLDDYIGVHSNINFQCLIVGCRHTWSASPGNIILRNSNCPMCAKKMKHFKETQKNDNLLESKNIKRLDEYITIRTKIRFQCLNDDCHYVWVATPTSIKEGPGCPRCSGTLKFTNQYVDEQIYNRNIRRLGNYINIDTKIKFKCLVKDCGFEWDTAPYNIINRKYGCPKCSARKNEKLIYKLLSINNVIFNYNKGIASFYKTNLTCQVDFHIPSINTIIEYNGAQHYRPVRFGGMSEEQSELNFTKQQERDNNLELFCKQNNINIIWIDGRQYFTDKLEDYVINELIPLIFRKELQ